MDDALRRAFAGPDFPHVRRGYLVLTEGLPRTLWEPGSEEPMDKVTISSMAEANKWGIVVPVSETALRDREELRTAFQRWQDATPEERAQWQREADEKRAEVRAAAAVEEDVLAGLGRHFGWSPEYIRHLAQPYCDCDWDNDGAWNYCPHAIDLGFNS